jgi:hypothetical protein
MPGAAVIEKKKQGQLFGASMEDTFNTLRQVKVAFGKAVLKPPQVFTIILESFDGTIGERDHSPTVKAVVRFVIDKDGWGLITEVSDRFVRLGQITATGCGVKCCDCVLHQIVVEGDRIAL